MHHKRSAAVLGLAAALLLVACTTTEPVDQGEDTTTTSTTAPPPSTTTSSTLPPVEPADCVDDAPSRPGTTQLVDTFVAAAGITEEGEPWEGCSRYEDESGTIAVEVPADWDQVAITPAPQGAAVVQARPPVDDREDPPFIGVGAGEGGDSADLDALLINLGGVTGTGCVPQQSADFDNGAMAGRVKAYIDCGDDSAWLFVAARPANGSMLLGLQAHVATLADVEALEHALNTFGLVG